jgi:hypothetical protein
MNVFVVTFDAGNEGDRQAIIRAIESFGSWIKLSDRCYALRTLVTHDQIATRLHYHIRDGQVHVLAIERPWSAVGLELINDWLERG